MPRFWDSDCHAMCWFRCGLPSQGFSGFPVLFLCSKCHSPLSTICCSTGPPLPHFLGSSSIVLTLLSWSFCLSPADMLAALTTCGLHSFTQACVTGEEGAVHSIAGVVRAGSIVIQGQGLNCRFEKFPVLEFNRYL